MRRHFEEGVGEAESLYQMRYRLKRLGDSIESVSVGVGKSLIGVRTPSFLDLARKWRYSRAEHQCASSALSLFSQQ